MRTKCTLIAVAAFACFSGPLLAQTTQPAQEQPSTTPQTTTDTAATRDNDMDYGWIGLLGLIGLAGLMGRRNITYPPRTGTTGSTTARSTRDQL